MAQRHVDRWERLRAELQQADHGERSMTVAEYNAKNCELDRIEASGRADEYPAGSDPRPWWRR